MTDQNDVTIALRHKVQSLDRGSERLGPIPEDSPCIVLTLGQARALLDLVTSPGVTSDE